MLRKIVFCAGCLAARGLTLGFSFALPSHTVVQRGCSRCKSAFQGGARKINVGSRRQEIRSSLSPRVTPRCRHGDEEVVLVVLDDKSASRQAPADDAVPAEGLVEAGNLQGTEQQAFATSAKAFLTGTFLACSFLASPLALLQPGYAAPPQEQSPAAMVAPERPRKVRPPPPEIPPGRITIVQWCERNIGRHLPKVDMQAAVRTVEKIRVNSGPAPTVEDLRSMAGDAAKREWAALFSDTIAGRRNKAVDSTEGSPSSVAAEAPAGMSEAAPPKSARQEQIDAMKAEMRDFQEGGGQEQSPASSSEPADPQRPFSRLTAVVPPSFKIGVTTPTGGEPLNAPRAALERPTSPKQKKKETRKVRPVAIDLKAELRAVSEKAATNTPERPEPRAAPRTSVKGQPTRLGGVDIVPPAPLYSPPEKPAPSFEASVGEARAGRYGESAKSSSDSAGLENAAVKASPVLEEPGLGRVSENARDVPGQRKKVAADDSNAEAGVAAVIKQGRDSVERLQAEASRISAGISDTAAPLVNKLSTGVSGLPEASRMAGSRLSELSGRVAAGVSGSARDVATRMGGVKDSTAGMVGAGAGMADRFSEMLGRGAGKILPSLGEAGRSVNDGISTLSRGVVDRLPEVQSRASALSSQILDASRRATSQLTDMVSTRREELSGRLSDLVSHGPEFSTDAKGALGKISTLGGSLAGSAIAAVIKLWATFRGLLGSLSSGEQGDGEAYAVAAVATSAVVGAAIAARSVGAGAKGGGRASGGGDDIEGGGGTVDEPRQLQPIGAVLEVGTPNDGQRHGVEAMSATGTLWDLIRDSGTGAGDAVREVSEEDLLARAVEVGEQLRETAEGLQVLKDEVLMLRESIRESDLEGKAEALREKLASALEGSVAD